MAGRAGQDEISVALRIDPKSDRQLLRALASLPPNVYARVVEQSAKTAMKAPLRVARQYRKRQTRASGLGLLGKSLGITSKKYPRTGTVWVAMGPRHGFRGVVAERDVETGRIVRYRLEDPTKIAHLVEFGTRPHSITRGARLGRRDARPGSKAALGVQKGPVLHPGTRPQPFLRPAHDSTKEAVIRTYRAMLIAGHDKEVRKLYRAS